MQRVHKVSGQDTAKCGLFIFTQDWSKLAGRIELHLKGTAFQLKVWEALLKVPIGGLTTYE